MLREDPSCPGPGCDDEQLRGFRQYLLGREDHAIGAEFKGIRDIYTTSGFRDLLLHECEHNLTLPQISRFLDENGLEFRGFQVGRSSGSASVFPTRYGPAT